MKKITILAVIAVFAVSVSSCDFIRQIAGRPTSNEIEALDEAELIAEPEDSLCCADTLCCKDSLCCPDSLCCKQQMPCDSCAKACCEAKPCEAKPCEECDAEAAPVAEPVVEAVPVEKPACEAKPCEEKPVCEAKPAPKAKPSRIFRGPVCPKAELANKYYVLIGTFKVEANVAAQVKRAEKAGYTVVTVPFKNGLTAVAVNPTDCKDEALKTLCGLKDKKFCPKDAYVLVVK